MEGNEPDARVSGYDLMAFSESNARHLIDRIRELRESGGITYTALWEGAGIKKSHSALSRWVNGEARWESIGKKDHQALVRYLIDNRLWYVNQWEDRASTIPDVLFHAVSTYLEIGYATRENIRKRVRGVFRVYHPSLMLTGRYVVGAAQLRMNAEAGCVEISSAFRYKPEEGEDLIPSREIHESYEGYLFRKSKKYFSLQRDRELSHMRMEVFPDTFGIEHDIKMMRGAVMSISENRAFYAPIYYDKVDPKDKETQDQLFERLKTESNIYAAKNIPEIVRAHLDEIPPSLFG